MLLRLTLRAVVGFVFRQVGTHQNLSVVAAAVEDHHAFRVDAKLLALGAVLEGRLVRRRDPHPHQLVPQRFLLAKAVGRQQGCAGQREAQQ